MRFGIVCGGRERFDALMGWWSSSSCVDALMWWCMLWKGVADAFGRVDEVVVVNEEYIALKKLKRS